MAIFTDLATETRFQIFEYLLQAPTTIKRAAVKQCDKPHPTPYSKQEVTNLFRRVNATAILFVSRQIHDEAVTVFYALNTIRIQHEDICLNVDECKDSKTYSTTTECLHGRHIANRRKLLQHAVLDDSSVWSPFYGCYCGDHLQDLVLKLNSEHFPRLKDLTINVKGADCFNELRRQLRRPSQEEDDECYDSGEEDEEEEEMPELTGKHSDKAWEAYHELIDRLKYEEDARWQAKEEAHPQLAREAGDEYRLEDDEKYYTELDIKYTGVGRFTVTGENIKPTIIFQYADLACTWDYYEALDIDDEELLDEDGHDHPGPLVNAPCNLIEMIHSFFRMRARCLAHAVKCEHFREHFKGCKAGKWQFSIAELLAGKFEEKAYEYLTIYLMPAATGQKYFSFFLEE
ncbi:hypothetical protein LTR56_009954 [Elasticomyces elasticus]|nr:hypothetical protein LTR56_009954 [Elasticomyces elasticus]KAK3656198.1 hypothetical protein LTR22_009905 [Elasticomyces elasticus]KAK4933741.1 hypothetical protein LTR49_000207 [Elasticomyces elasticus]KAK5756543.1 hypothetical protein LTS12_013378 [Elasticomyces elasticus]